MGRGKGNENGGCYRIIASNQRLLDAHGRRLRSLLSTVIQEMHRNASVGGGGRTGKGPRVCLGGVAVTLNMATRALVSPLTSL